MKKILKEYFDKRKIEFFEVVDYTLLKEINSRISDKMTFYPKSVIIYLIPYYTGDTVNISRYAASLDYHILLSEENNALEKHIKHFFPYANMCGYGDHSPIDERYAALISGLGILGDNGLIINEKYGSYCFIGEMITDIPPEKLGAAKVKPIRECLHCGRCKSACPTGILNGNSTDCLSAITQKKGELSPWEKELMIKHNTAWGCDICQSVCPYNSTPKKTPIEFFYRDRIEHLTLDMLGKMSDSEFSQRAFAWRKRKTVERNLQILENSTYCKE